MPHLQRLYDAHKAEGLEIMAVNSRDSVALIKKLAEREKLAFRILRPDAAAQDVADRYGVTGSPTTYVIGRDGRIALAFAGYGDWPDAVNPIFMAARRALIEKIRK